MAATERVGEFCKLENGALLAGNGEEQMVDEKFVGMASSSVCLSPCFQVRYNGQFKALKDLFRSVNTV